MSNSQSFDFHARFARYSGWKVKEYFLKVADWIGFSLLRPFTTIFLKIIWHTYYINKISRQKFQPK